MDFIGFEMKMCFPLLLFNVMFLVCNGSFYPLSPIRLDRTTAGLQNAK
jgi:hypothetical protein